MSAHERVGGLRDVLTQTEAAARARAVTDVAYELELDLCAGQESYTGRTVIDLTVLDRAAPLFLDLTGRVTSMRVDGDPVRPDHRGHRLWLPVERLGERARIEIGVHNAYDRTGAGFHHFTDPEDGEEYVHSDFEPYAAHRLFPCFDQPDIKATYQLTVDAPAAWSVVSAGAEVGSVALPDGRLRRRFARTPRFSTYLLAIVAGPYARVTGEHDGIPLGVYGRRSMERILEREAPEILEVTAQGFDLYRELFG
jgi:aminopeptidase N